MHKPEYGYPDYAKGVESMQGTVKDAVAPGPRQDAEVPRAFVSIQDIDDPCVWELESLPWEVLGGRIAAPFRHQKRILVTPNLLVYGSPSRVACTYKG